MNSVSYHASVAIIYENRIAIFRLRVRRQTMCCGDTIEFVKQALHRRRIILSVALAKNMDLYQVG
jgi:hypothetical protein